MSSLHDKDTLEPALDVVDQRWIKPETLLADSHYGPVDCLQKGRQRNVEMIAPAQTPKGKPQGKLTLEDFELDDEGRIIRCPGEAAPVSVIGQCHRVKYPPETNFMRE